MQIFLFLLSMNYFLPFGNPFISLSVLSHTGTRPNIQSIKLWRKTFGNYEANLLISIDKNNAIERWIYFTVFYDLDANRKWEGSEPVGEGNIGFIN